MNVATGAVTDIVGSGSCGSFFDHYGTTAKFHSPLGIAYHAFVPHYKRFQEYIKIRLYVADYGANRVRYVLPAIIYAGTLVEIAKPKDVYVNGDDVYILTETKVVKVCAHILDLHWQLLSGSHVFSRTLCQQYQLLNPIAR